MSKIEWTDVTWNPFTGCTKVSPGCDNCYMYAMYPRLKGMAVRGYEKDAGTVQVHEDRIWQPIEWGSKRRRVFVNSMSDTFHNAVPDKDILRLFASHGHGVLGHLPGADQAPRARCPLPRIKCTMTFRAGETYNCPAGASSLQTSTWERR